MSANSHYDTIKYTAEISDSEIIFLDTKEYKGERFNRESTLNMQTHYKKTEIFQYINSYFSSTRCTNSTSSMLDKNLVSNYAKRMKD